MIAGPFKFGIYLNFCWVLMSTECSFVLLLLTSKSRALLAVVSKVSAIVADVIEISAGIILDIAT